MKRSGTTYRGARAAYTQRYYQRRATRPVYSVAVVTDTHVRHYSTRFYPFAWLFLQAQRFSNATTGLSWVAWER